AAARGRGGHTRRDGTRRCCNATTVGGTYTKGTMKITKRHKNILRPVLFCDLHCAFFWLVPFVGQRKVMMKVDINRREFIAGAVGIGAAGAALRLEAALPAAGLDHVNIRVPNVGRAAEFYIKLFGIQVARAPNAKAQTANPASPSGELWFIRLGEGFLAIS